MKTVNIQEIEQNIVALSYNKDFAIIDNITEIAKQFDDVFAIEGYIAVIVHKGTCNIKIKEQLFELSARDIFICNPRNILEGAMFSLDFEFVGLFLSPNYVDHLIEQTNLTVSLRMITMKHEILHTTEEEMQRIVEYMKLLRSKLSSTGSYKEQVIDRLMQIMVYEIIGLMEDSEKEFLMKREYISAENIMQKFLSLIQNESIAYLNVTEYANLLHISPKYFSSVCKKLTGKTASEIINDEIIKQSSFLLRNNQLSIKQISSRLGFVNQSHFGTFFRRHTGLSPQQYREQ
ncbi:helix-turn-helix domain-containing protein [Phocaeicola paurosaccharolyticus]|uniref:helix-turn-helix domain-containing protein n=1 Tax=Phocaeicola paurosaccharolyticus TaxID=732242 RepID=UPI000468F2AB|nr:helix-turn-helix transcriptional regulator [Phocaeicola paurosaccharolyticus]